MTASSSETTAIAWIESEALRHHGKQVELPSTSAANNSLCEFLRDGRALCLLAMALAEDANSSNNNDQVFALPKKIEKSMHQLSTFHALERIHFFIRWCRAAAQLEEHLVFTSVQLLDETNADAVLATIDALRTRFRPSFVSPIKTETRSPEEEEEEDNNATGNDTETSSVTSSRSSTAPPSSSSSLSNKLSAFLTKVPSAPPTIAPTVERQTSLSNSSSVSRDSRLASSASVTSSADDDDHTSESSASDTRNRSTSNGRLSASPRGSGGVSKLKMPGAFASLATVTIASPPPVEEEEPAPPVVEEPVVVVEEVNSSTPNRDAVDDFDERIKVVHKLEIPMVFGRQRSASSVDESSSVKSDGGESVKSLPRSVSKLKIPKAFAGGAGDEPPPPVEEEEPAPPVVEEPISNSPKSKLAAFAKTLAPTPPPAEPVVEETKAKSKKKSNGKLKIPAAFGKSVSDTPAVKAAITKKKPVTKLSAFLSTVENDVPPPIEAKPEKRFAFPIPGTEEAKKPVKKPAAVPVVVKTRAAASKSAKLAAFMTKVVAAPPTMAARVERDSVPDHDHHDEEEVKPVEKKFEEKAPVVVEEEKKTQPSARASALAAFMKKVVVAPPAPAPRAERDEPVVEKIEESVAPEPEAPAVGTLKVQLVEEESSVDPSPSKGNRLLAFLSKVESPTAPLSEAGEDVVASTTLAGDETETSVPSASVPLDDDDHDDDFARPVVNADPDHNVIVEVSGELTHEAILRRRLSLTSPRAKPKSIAACKLFPEDEEDESVAPVKAVSAVHTADGTDVALAKFQELQHANKQVQAENELLQQKLLTVEAVVSSQNTTLETLQAELKALRQQMETQNETIEAKLLASEKLANERLAQLTAVQQTLDDQQIVVTQAQESEEAARYAARQAFTARDDAEDARRVLQEKLDALSRAA